MSTEVPTSGRRDSKYRRASVAPVSEAPDTDPHLVGLFIKLGATRNREDGSYSCSLDEFRGMYHYLGVSRLQLEEVIFPLRVQHASHITFEEFVDVLHEINPHLDAQAHTPTSGDTRGFEGEQQRRQSSHAYSSQNQQRLGSAGSRRRKSSFKPNTNAGTYFSSIQPRLSTAGIHGPSAMSRFEDVMEKEGEDQHQAETRIRVGGRNVYVKNSVSGIAGLAISEMDRLQREEAAQQQQRMHAYHYGNQPYETQPPPEWDGANTAPPRSRGNIVFADNDRQPHQHQARPPPQRSTAQQHTSRPSSGRPPYGAGSSPNSRRQSSTSPRGLASTAPAGSRQPSYRSTKPSAKSSTAPRPPGNQRDSRAPQRHGARSTSAKRRKRSKGRRLQMQEEDPRIDMSDEMCIAEVPPISHALTPTQLNTLSSFHHLKAVGATVIVQAYVEDQIAIRRRILASCISLLQRTGRGYCRCRLVLGRLLKRASVRASLNRHSIESFASFGATRSPIFQQFQGSPYRSFPRYDSPPGSGVESAGFVHPSKRMAPLRPAPPSGGGAGSRPTSTKGQRATPQPVTKSPESQSLRVDRDETSPISRTRSTQSMANGSQSAAARRQLMDKQRRSNQLALKEKAAKAIQRFCQLLICRIRYHHMRRDVVEVIQEQERAETLILLQTIMRAKSAERRRLQLFRVHRRRHAARVIQRFWRMCFATVQLQQRQRAVEEDVENRTFFEKFENAVRIASSFWQRYHSVKYVQQRRKQIAISNDLRVKKEKRWEAAQSLQFFASFVKVRTQYKIRLRKHKAIDEERIQGERRELAAVQIQRGVRGMLARKRRRLTERRIARQVNRRTLEEQRADAVLQVQLWLIQKRPVEDRLARLYVVQARAIQTLQRWAPVMLATARVRRIQRLANEDTNLRTKAEREDYAATKLQGYARTQLALHDVQQRQIQDVVRRAVTGALATDHPDETGAERAKQKELRVRRRKEGRAARAAAEKEEQAEKLKAKEEYDQEFSNLQKQLRAEARRKKKLKQMREKEEREQREREAAEAAAAEAEAGEDNLSPQGSLSTSPRSKSGRVRIDAPDGNSRPTSASEDAKRAAMKKRGSFGSVRKSQSATEFRPSSAGSSAGDSPTPGSLQTSQTATFTKR